MEHRKGGSPSHGPFSAYLGRREAVFEVLAEEWCAMRTLKPQGGRLLPLVEPRLRLSNPAHCQPEVCLISGSGRWGW
jgi:hypothetical protein